MPPPALPACRAQGRRALPAELEFGAVATSLADPAAAPDAQQASPPGPPGAQPEPDHGPAPEAVERACAKCGAPMDAAQDWCLHCGAGAPGSLGGPPAGWRSGATILALTAVLALGAGAAAYAALSKGRGKAHVLTTTVAQSPAAAAPAPATPAPASPGTPTTVKPATPVTPPKIPLTAATPKPAGTTSTPTPAAGQNTPTTPSSSNSGGAPAAGETQPSSILLDTNAAATYNPYTYPASDFGDPSLTIDGDSSTGWTAQLDPTVAPKMAEGLVIDLKSPRKLSALALVTSTPGMTIQVYGANGKTLPTSITDHAWVKLTPNLLEKSKHPRLKLKAPKKAFRFVTLWISGAPASSVGTPQAPGHVSVNELELFPAR
jgi:hypothetical protein